MANTDTAFGIRPLRKNGLSMVGQGTRVYVNDTSSVVGLGSPVTLTGNGDGSAPGVRLCVVNDTDTASNDDIFGIVTAFLGDSDEILDRSDTKYAPAGTPKYALVETDVLNTLFEVQSDGTHSSADIGLTYNFELGSVDTTTGYHDVQIDQSVVVGGNVEADEMNCQLVGFSEHVANEPASANAKLIVRLVNHWLSPIGAGVNTA